MQVSRRGTFIGQRKVLSRDPVSCVVVVIQESTLIRTVILSYELTKLVVHVADFLARAVLDLCYISVLIVGISISNGRAVYVAFIGCDLSGGVVSAFDVGVGYLVFKAYGGRSRNVAGVGLTRNSVVDIVGKALLTATGWGAYSDVIYKTRAIVVGVEIRPGGCVLRYSVQVVDGIINEI